MIMNLVLIGVKGPSEISTPKLGGQAGDPGVVVSLKRNINFPKRTNLSFVRRVWLLFQNVCTQFPSVLYTDWVRI